MTSTEVLGTYLDDHLAGANAGVEMARRLHERAGAGPDAATLGRLAEETESLALGIAGKLLLWQALLAVAPAYPHLVEADLMRLADRAREQHSRIETIRLAAVRRSFTPPS